MTLNFCRGRGEIARNLGTLSSVSLANPLPEQRDLGRIGNVLKVTV